MIFLQGTYKINITDSAGAQIPGFPVDNVQGGVGADSVGEDYYYPSADAADQGITGDSNTIKYAVDTINTDTGTIYLSHDGGTATTTYTLTTSEAIPSNINLIPENGAIIDGAGTLTLDSTSQIKAQPEQQQVFGSAITVVFTNGGDAHPGWYDIDGTADEVQINAAITSISTGGGKVKLQAKTYVTAATINVLDAIHLQGSGDNYTTGGTIISNGANVPAITVSGATGYAFEISNFHIVGNSGTDDGIYLVQSGGSVPRTARIHDVSMTSIGRDGVRIDGASYVELNNVTVHSAGANGFSVLDVTADPLQEFIYFINCRTNACTGNGLNITSGGSIYSDRCNFDADAIGVFISGDAFQLHFSDLTISGATSYGIELNADDAWLARIYFRDVYIFMVGSSADERAIYGHRGGAYGLTDISFHDVDIAKAGATAPTYSIEITEVFLKSELLRIRDAANANAYSVSLPTDQTFTYTSNYSPAPTAFADDATPSVAGGKMFYTGGTTTITDFDDGVNGQIVIVFAQHTITITDGTNIFLSGSANFDMTSSDTLTLMCYSDNKWYEVSRGDNGA